MRLHPLAACVTAFCVLSTAGSAQIKAHARPQMMGAAEPTASTHFSVFLPLTNKTALEQLLVDQTTTTSPSYHKWLTPAQFKAQFGPNPADVASVKHKLESSGLTVTEHIQSLEVTGPVSAVEHLFSTHLNQVRMAKGNTRFAAANHRLTLPAELSRAGAVIPAFAPHLASHVHSERLNASGRTTALLKKASLDQRLSSANSFFYPNDMKEAYDFASFTTKVTPKATAPSGTPVQIAGLGAKIGIVISSTVLQSDINSSFKSTVSTSSTNTDVQNFPANTTIPIPAPVIQPVDGGSGAFNASSDDADEASLDTQMSLGTAPGAKEVVYDMPDLSDESIIDAYTLIDEQNFVDVVSSSFGECELDFTAAANGGTDYTFILDIFHSLFAQGNSQGITFVASSGDNGAVPCLSTAFDNDPTNGTNFVLGVENPASDPAVTAVGGTNLQVAATPTINDSTYVSENANYDPRVPAEFELSDTSIVSVGNNTWGSGGGYSIYFAKPSYQSYVSTGSTTARAVPDVSLMMGGCPGDADLTAQDCTELPRSAAIVWIGGEPNLLIGTSSSAPQMAGVIALSVEIAGGRLGNINPQLYTLSALQSAASAKTANLAQYFHRTVTGNNNGFKVVPGQVYSTVLGNGTLFVKNYLQLQSAAAAGTPNTATNP